jgi:hypothetical protein
MNNTQLVDSMPTSTEHFLAQHYTSLIEQAFQLDKIDELSYERLRRLSIKTLDDSEHAYQDFATCLRDRLLDRIIKGAQYIEKHGEVPAAVSRYNKLCAELEKLDGRRTSDT